MPLQKGLKHNFLVKSYVVETKSKNHITGRYAHGCFLLDLRQVLNNGISKTERPKFRNSLILEIPNY